MKLLSTNKRIWPVTTLLLALILTGLLAFLFLRKPPSTHNILTLPTPQQTHLHCPFIQKPIHWTIVTIKPHDSLASIFLQHHLPYNDLLTILKLPNAQTHLNNIRPTQQLQFDIKNGTLQKMRYPINPQNTLLIERSANGFTAHIETKPLQSALAYKSGVIQSSFATSAKRAGLTHALAAQLVTLFQGDINFSRGIQKGDRFRILYKEYYVDGKKNHPGKIVAAEFVNHGKPYRAVYFAYPQHHSGYFTPDGHGIAPLFLMPPLKYRRISSHFTYHRLDPILHVIRPHLGVDYAARRGTPIHAIGDGKVIFAGHERGYGNAIVIRYNWKYKSLYGHMSRIAHGMHHGVHVHRGQVVGYVGSTGWSTGPHLHLSLYVFGIPRDPLKMHFPKSHSVPSAQMPAFLQQAKKWLSELDLHKESKHG